VGGDAEEVIAGYRLLTGAAPLFPRGLYGFIQCRERYQTAGELVSTVEEHRRRGIPLDVIVQDWRYWGEMAYWSGMVHDPESYGVLPEAARRIHALLMISIWPAVGPETDLYRELEAGGYLFPAVHWSSGRIYDAFDPAAREIYWRHARRGLFDHGVDAWWMDGTEPEFGDCHDPGVHKAALQAQPATAAGSWARVLNAFSLATTTGVYEGQRSATDDKRVFILSRSAFAGQQRNATATWSGDISSTSSSVRKSKWALFFRTESRPLFCRQS
jgi:alpha-D-xyloside xylohydrolase